MGSLFGKKCSKCDGDGWVEHPHNRKRLTCSQCEHLYGKCPSCEGTGSVADPQHGHAFKCEACSLRGDGRGRIKKCGMGYPSMELPCIRPAGHASPVSECFAVKEGNGVYMQQDGKDWVGTDRRKWPEDALVELEAEPEVPQTVKREERVAATTGRRAAIEATKAKHAKE